MAEPEPLLEVEELTIRFPGAAGPARVVERVSLELRAGETLAVVGESGSGKTVLALSILGLVDPPGRVAGGSVRYRGRDLTRLGADELRAVRGGEIAMIFQEPQTALNPVLSIGLQVAEGIELHAGTSRAEALRRAIGALERVGLPDPERLARCFPHQLSGGMRQRAMIAMAIAPGPRVLIADEPTTALDATVQAQILDLLDSLVKAGELSMILISHDLGVVAGVADRTAVMYAGRLVESADTPTLFARAAHPYTRGLLRALPERSRPGQPLATLAGVVPRPDALPQGCAFHPRCALARDECARVAPVFEPVRGGAPGHGAACPYSGEVAT